MKIFKNLPNSSDLIPVLKKNWFKYIPSHPGVRFLNLLVSGISTLVVDTSIPFFIGLLNVGIFAMEIARENRKEILLYFKIKVENTKHN